MEDTQVEPLLSVIKDLTLNPAAQESFAADPAAYLDDRGYGELPPEDLHEALGLVAETLPPEQAMALAPPGTEVAEDADDVLEALQRLVDAGAAEEDLVEGDPASALDADLTGAESEAESISGFGEGTGEGTTEDVVDGAAEPGLDDALAFGAGSAATPGDGDTTGGDPIDDDLFGDATGDAVFGDATGDAVFDFPADFDTADDDGFGADESDLTTSADIDPGSAGDGTPDDFGAF